ncbi:type IX secretion system protein PorQ [Marinilabiliaceae bacterium ANBcel2]|nr:type IX secretion system protein PorQ [Marinilabiliaceae bacterium ANBcel2]
MIKKIVYITTIILLNFTSIYSQKGGETLFSALQITHSARLTALGGNQTALKATDLSMLQHNPATLDSSLLKNITVGFVPYLAGINYGYAGYAFNTPGNGQFAIGLYHLNYGNFDGRDQFGTETGTFSAGETILQLTYSMQLHERVKAGISFKPLYSKIERYNSWGLAADLGVIYNSENSLTSYGIALRNFGYQITAYDESHEGAIKPDLQIGVTHKPRHAPFRLSLTAQNLIHGSLNYSLNQSQNNDDSNSFAQNILRHTTIGVEFLPSENFYIAAGVNPKRRQELKIESKTSTVGFSWGLGFKVDKFNFSYGSSHYHLGGSSNHFTVTTRLADW